MAVLSSEDLSVRCTVTSSSRDPSAGPFTLMSYLFIIPSSLCLPHGGTKELHGLPHGSTFIWCELIRRSFPPSPVLALWSSLMLYIFMHSSSLFPRIHLFSLSPCAMILPPILPICLSLSSMLACFTDFHFRHVPEGPAELT